MSKLNIDRVKDSIAGILDGAKEKPRKFVETIELQIGLKDYDTQRDKRFAGTVKLPHVPRMRLKVCILGDAVHCEQAQNLGLPFRSVDDLKKLNKNKKLVKKLALQYDAFLASQVRVFEMSLWDEYFSFISNYLTLSFQFFSSHSVFPFLRRFPAEKIHSKIHQEDESSSGFSVFSVFDSEAFVPVNFWWHISTSSNTSSTLKTRI